MPRTNKISREQASEIAEARKGNHDKQVEKRLRAVELRGEGKKNSEIAVQLETSKAMVSRWVSWYVEGGLPALLPKKREAHRRNMSYAEEASLLAGFEKVAQAGQVVEVSEIKAAYVEKVGHPIGNGQIYRVLKRHGWRKVKPRSRHPKKATLEAIQASKKLTTPSKTYWKILQQEASD
jgi:transposase